MEIETRTVYSGTCFDPTVPPREGFRSHASYNRQDVIDWLALKAETGHTGLRLKTSYSCTQTFEASDLLTS